MHNFDNYYNKQKLLQESLMKELAMAAMAIALSTVTGNVISDKLIAKNPQKIVQMKQQAQQQGYNMQQIEQVAKSPQVIKQAKQIVMQNAQQKPVDQPVAVEKPKQSAPKPVESPKKQIAAAIANPQLPAKQAAPVQPKSAARNVITFVAKTLKELGKFSPQALAAIVANIRGETGPAMRPTTESLNYRPERLKEVFKHRVKTLEQAREIVTDPVKLGNFVYGGRLGNGPDEGYKYRGRGYFQITGKENYERIGKAIGEDLVNDPERANDDAVAKKVLKYMIADMIKKGVNIKSVSSVTKKVGPAQTDVRIAERTKWYDKILQMIKNPNTITSQIP